MTIPRSHSGSPSPCHGVRGSLILSRDGLGARCLPRGGRGPREAGLVEVRHLGEPDKSFVEFADQVWAFVKRGRVRGVLGRRGGHPTRHPRRPDGAGAPGRAEEGRSKRETVRLPDAANRAFGQAAHVPAPPGRQAAGRSDGGGSRPPTSSEAPPGERASGAVDPMRRSLRSRTAAAMRRSPIHRSRPPRRPRSHRSRPSVDRLRRQMPQRPLRSRRSPRSSSLPRPTAGRRGRVGSRPSPSGQRVLGSASGGLGDDEASS